LEHSGKPFVYVAEDVPPTDILEQMKRKNAVLGLLADDQTAVEYFKKLDHAKRLLGASRLMVMNESPLGDKANTEFFRRLMREILQAGYEWSDIQNIFSATFLHLFR